MANVDFPRGFIPIDGSMRTHNYPIASNNSQIGLYDLVERRSDGLIHPAQASSTTIIGSAAEAKAANAGGTLAVYDDPNLIFEAQMDEADADAQTDFDLNYNIVATTPNTTTGQSQMEIDSSTQAATATLPIKILRLRDVQTAAGNALGANAVFECIINNHVLKSTGVNG